MNEEELLKGLLSYLSSQVDSLVLFEEIKIHKNTKALFKSDKVKNLDLRVILNDIIASEDESRLSSSKLKFLNITSSNFFDNSSTDNRWI